jgi:uncharacterized protein (DUF885 family)
MGTTDSSVTAISEVYVADFCDLDPITASYLGFAEYDNDLPDYSPDGYRARAELGANALRAIEAATPVNDAEQLAKDVFAERVGLAVEIHQAGLEVAAYNAIENPVWAIRQCFDMMPTENAEHWEIIAQRLARVPAAVAGVRTSLVKALNDGNAPTLRQVTKLAGQCEVWAGSQGQRPFFTTLAGSAEVGRAQRAQLMTLAEQATKAYAGFGSFLRDEIAPRTPDRDAVGLDAYRIWSRNFTGARLDLDEAYEWGWTEFLRIGAEMKQVAERIRPGATPAEVAELLDADPRHHVLGREEFRTHLQDLSDRALAELRGVHFDIPDELMKLECRLAPPGGSIGGYYAGPSDDFSRPAGMWWSLPSDQEVFPTWREVSVLYHEGVPGHHLQIATAMYQKDKLNTYQRLLAFVSAHAEGWSLYAERLMRDLGYLDDDAHVLGMLLEEQLRAARVILDIGMHLRLKIPAGTGFHEGERWTPDLGLAFLNERTISDKASLPDEIDRYLGWAGQAPGYKLGERVWLAAINDARQRHGTTFNLKHFHAHALAMGSIGLDLLQDRLAAY